MIFAFGVGAVKTTEPRWQRANVRAAAAVIDAEAGPDDVVLDSVWLGGEPPNIETPLLETLDISLERPHRVVRADSPEAVRLAQQEARGHLLWVIGNPLSRARFSSSLTTRERSPPCSVITKASCRLSSGATSAGHPAGHGVDPNAGIVE